MFYNHKKNYIKQIIGFLFSCLFYSVIYSCKTVIIPPTIDHYKESKIIPETLNTNDNLANNITFTNIDPQDNNIYVATLHKNESDGNELLNIQASPNIKSRTEFTSIDKATHNKLTYSLEKAILNTKNKDEKNVIIYNKKKYKFKNINNSGTQAKVYILTDIDGQEDIIIKIFEYYKNTKFIYHRINIFKELMDEFKFHKTLLKYAKDNTIWCNVAYFRQMPFLIKKAVNGYTLKEILSKRNFTQEHANAIKSFLKNISQSKRSYLDMHANNIMFDAKTNNFVLVDSKPPINEKSVTEAYKANIRNFKSYIIDSKANLFTKIRYKTLKVFHKWYYEYRNSKNRQVMKQLLNDLSKILKNLN